MDAQAYKIRRYGLGYELRQWRKGDEVTTQICRPRQPEIGNVVSLSQPFCESREQAFSVLLAALAEHANKQQRSVNL